LFNCKFTAGDFANLRPNASYNHHGIKSKVVVLFEGYRSVPILSLPKQNTTFTFLLFSPHFLFLTEKRRWAGGERIRAAKERTASGKLLDHREGQKNVGQCPLKGKKLESGRNGKKGKRKSTFFIFKID
jgi:hypothetical protein